MRHFTLALFALLLVCIPGTAAQSTLIALNIDNPDLQTGQYYDVQITVENVTGLWLADVAIAYDPAQLYIQGTRSGSPVTPGPFIDANNRLVVQNRVRDGQIEYTVSLVAPAEPVSGTGVIGTFRIYPLAPGPAQLVFTSGELLGLEYTTDEEGRRDIEDTPALDFTPILIDLSVSGDSVDIPPEVTATPPPSLTPIAAEATDEAVNTATPEPTLANVTRAPQTVTATITDAAAVEEPPASADLSPLLPVVIGALVISGLGILLLLVLWLRGRRS